MVAKVVTGIAFLRQELAKLFMKRAAKKSGIMTLPFKNKKLQLDIEDRVQEYVLNAQKQGVDLNTMSNQNLKYTVQLNEKPTPLVRFDNDDLRTLSADSPEGRQITEALLGKRKAEVVDMTGKKIKNPQNIMGGQEVETDIVTETITLIKSKKPIEGMKEANSVIGRKGKYKNLTEEQSQKILKDTNDHIFERDIPIDPEDMATGGRAGLYQGGHAEIQPDLSDIGHGSDALMARNTLLTPGSQATTSTGLNYLLGEDNDTTRVPYEHGETVLPKPKPMDEYMLKQVLSQAGANTLDTRTRDMFIKMYKKKIREKNKKADGGRTGFRGGGSDASTTSFSGSFDRQHGTNTASRANKTVDRRQGDGPDRSAVGPGSTYAQNVAKQTTVPEKIVKAADTFNTANKAYNIYKGGGVKSLFGLNPWALGAMALGKMNQKKKSLANQIGFNQTYQDPWRNPNLTYDETTGQFLDASGNIVNSNTLGATQAKTYGLEDLKSVGAETEGWTKYTQDPNKTLQAIQDYYDNAKKLTSNATQTLEFNTPTEVRSKVENLGNIPFSGYEKVDMDLVPKDFLSDKIDFTNQKSPETFYAHGGPARQNFKMGKRAFLQWMFGAGAGILGAKTGLLSLLKGGGKKQVIKELTSVPINNIDGMPVWFKPLVNKVIKEGDDVTKKFADADRQIVHTTKLPNSQTDVIVTQDLSTGNVAVDIGMGKHGFKDGLHGQPVRLEYKAAEDIMRGPDMDDMHKVGVRDPHIKVKRRDEMTFDQKKHPDKAPEEFWVEEAEFTGGHPENVKFEDVSYEKFGEHGSNFDEVEKFATGKVKKTKTTESRVFGKKYLSEGDDMASGGRVPMWLGGGLTAGKGLTREMLKFMAKGSSHGKSPAEMLKMLNPKQFEKLLKDLSMYNKFSPETGIMAPDMIKNMIKKTKTDRTDMIEQLISSARSIKKGDDNIITYKNKIIEEMVSKGMDRKTAETLSETLSESLLKEVGPKGAGPKITEQGLLELENIQKNLITKDRQLQASGGRASLSAGGLAGMLGE